jgi:hypothetical protein
MMSPYSVILMVHVIAVLVMAGVLSIEAVALLHLRGASIWEEAVPWITPVPRISIIAALSIVLIVISGGYLVMQESASQRAWARVALGAVLLMGPLGATTGRRLRAIRNAVASRDEMHLELLRRVRQPFLKVSLGVRISVFLGIFLLVSTKPGLLQSLILIGAAASVGFASSLLLEWSHNPRLATKKLNLGN